MSYKKFCRMEGSSIDCLILVGI